MLTLIHDSDRPVAERPPILAVTSEVPWPLNSGGHLRTYYLLRALGQRLKVRLVAPVVPGDHGDGLDASLRAADLNPTLVPVPRRHILGESAKAMAARVGREPYVMFARHRRRRVRRALEREIGRSAPAAMYLDHLDSLVYAPLAGAIPLVVDMHNVYSRLVARAAEESRGWFRRRYLSFEARLLADMERRVAQVADTVLAVSDEEADYFRSLGARRTVLVPNGVDCDAFAALPLAERMDPPTLLYVGSLAWPPNASAARFLASEVLPAVRARVPRARLLIVGRDPLPEVLALGGPHVDIAANVADVIPYFRRAHVLTVPLQAGGGTRLKILEAFAGGLPVISTAVGCEGLGAVDGHHLVIAERDDFVAATVALLHDPRRARALAHQARVLARERFDWSIVGARACDAVRSAAARASVGKREALVEQARRVGHVGSVPRP